MARETKITVRVQAKGGKFLGDDIGGALVTIRDSRTGAILASGAARGDSGTLKSDYSPNASQSAIITPGARSPIQWLHAAATTSRFDATLQLDRPTLVEISAFGPVGGLQTAHGVSTKQWMIPGQHITSGPGFVVELPGLVVQVLEPPTHLELPFVPARVELLANITMMCGCQIAEGGAWIPKDFDVFADIGLAGSSATTRVPLSHDKQPSSRFGGAFEMQEAGYYLAGLTAIQKSTGNTGTAQVTFYYEPTECSTHLGHA